MNRRGQHTMLRLILMSALGVGCSHAERIAFKKGGVDTKGSPDEVLQVALVQGTVYGLTVSGRIRAWNIAGGELRTLDHAHVYRLAADGSVAVSVTKAGASGTMLEVWEPATDRLIAKRTFELGASVYDAARSVLLLELTNPAPHPSANWQQVLPERSHFARWDLIRDQLVDNDRLPVTYRGLTPDLSRDGTRMLVNSGEGGPMLFDLVGGHATWPPPLAPEWEPTARRDGSVSEDAAGEDIDDSAPVEGRRHCPKCLPAYSRSPIDVISALLAPDGASVYFAYNGSDKHQEWRLERWIPGAGPSDRGSIERLAVVRSDISDEVLAVSHSGTTVVTGGRRRPVTVRRAPRFEAETLSLASANAAVFSLDDQRLVTGHEDGRFVVWDAGTLRVIAASVAVKPTAEAIRPARPDPSGVATAAPTTKAALVRGSDAVTAL